MQMSPQSQAYFYEPCKARQLEGKNLGSTPSVAVGPQSHVPILLPKAGGVHVAKVVASASAHAASRICPPVVLLALFAIPLDVIVTTALPLTGGAAKAEVVTESTNLLGSSVAFPAVFRSHPHPFAVSVVPVAPV